jgi:hypothetical protein
VGVGRYPSEFNLADPGLVGVDISGEFRLGDIPDRPEYTKRCYMIG